MKSPAYNPFIKSAGKIVHYLNTIAVGLSGVESGFCSKPETLDISWSPQDLVSSSRESRAFALKSAMVFVVEELNNYNTKILNSPVVLNKNSSNIDRASLHILLCSAFQLQKTEYMFGPLLLIHWRNRIIHKKSNAALTRQEITDFTAMNEAIKSLYKNLDVSKLLEHFNMNTPTLKDVSSLIAMTINYVHKVESQISEPKNKEEFLSWLKALDLLDDFIITEKKSTSAKDSTQSMVNFLNTNCPSLIDSYKQHYCA